MSELPKGWVEADLSELVPHDGLMTDGDWVESKDQDPNGDVRLIQLADIGDGCFRDKSARFLTKRKAIELNCTYLRKGDVLIARMPDPLGRACLFPLSGKEKFVTVVDVCVVRLSEETVSNRYITYLINSGAIRQQIESFESGTTRKRISGKNLARVRLPIAPLAEQRRIVGKVEELFSELEEGVANLKQARAQLAVYRQALLKHAFEGHLTADWRTQHAPELESADQLLARIRAEMPDNSKNSAPDVSSSACGWLELSLSDITKESLIGLVRSSDLQNQEGRGFCYIKMDRVDMSGHVDIEPKVFVDCSEEEVERFALRQGDILFNTRNSVELVGKTGLVRKPPPGPTVFNNNLMRIRLVSPVLPSFLNYQMCAPDFRNAMEQVKKATTSVAAVYGKDLWPLRIAIPSTREQQAIVDKLDSQLDVVESMEADIDLNLQKAEALRQSILKKAFAGELVPQDPADEPAAALLARIRAEREAQPVNRRTRR